jgi:hypothetical protein
MAAPMSRVTFGCAGHGLLLAPVSPCRLLVTDDDELVVAHGADEVARITPGDGPATAAATWIDGTRARFGEGGPLLELVAPGTFDGIFERVDVGVGEGPWTALGRGFMIDLPAGVVLLSASPGDDDRMFELHALGGRDEMIVFEPCPIAAERVNIRPAPYQELVEEGTFSVHSPDGVRQLRIIEFAYEADAREWRQIVIPVPLDEGRTMLVKAQATPPRVPVLFAAAQRVAATLGPLG